jgi:hypothetical protein
MIFSAVAVLAGSAQRPGGEVRKRTDEKGAEYYEVFADARNGEHGGPAPMRLTSGGPKWPRSLTIRAESTWNLRKSLAESVDANGGNESCPNCPLPSARAGALIARWAKLDVTSILGLLTRRSTEPVTDWTFIGRSITIALPIPSLVAPKPLASPPTIPGIPVGPELAYTPLVALQYRINDSDVSDNDGWLHVYQEWVW